MTDHLVFAACQFNGQTIIDIKAVEDTQFETFTPSVTDLRGITFYVPDSHKAELRIGCARLPESEIQRNPADDTGRQSVGITWFQPDYTDYTTWTRTEVKLKYRLGDRNGIQLP